MTESSTATITPTAEAERTRSEIFAYSGWVHVAPDDCPLVRALAADPQAGKTSDLPVCGDPGHFHAWIRLPNPYQVRDINEKARAARARVIRSLRDENSDAYIIMEEELDELRNERVKPQLVTEIVDKDFADHYDEAVRDALDIDDPSWRPEDDDEDAEPAKLYAHIDADQEEYARQVLLPEDQRDETFAELERTVGGFATAVDEALERIRQPLRAELEQRDMDELVEFVRRDRIDARAQEMYLHTWNTWQWYVCTYEPVKRGTPAGRKFKDVNTFKYDTPAPVVNAIQKGFSELERRLTGASQGNS